MNPLPYPRDPGVGFSVVTAKRKCGECTMCCKTMGVIDLPTPKPAHKWCEHCSIGVGCKIYESRPTTCRTFECVWLQDTRNLFGDDCRPDRLGVVFQPTSDSYGLVAHCDPTRPTAWRNPKALDRLRACARAGFHASARAGERYWVITSTKEWEVPHEYLVRGPNGKVDVRIPHDVAIEIGVRT